MARLIEARSGHARPLAARTLIGRSSFATLRLDSPLISSEHAVLSWTPDGVWELRDLGSTNGTFADGVRLAAGSTVDLADGATIAFGDPAQRWHLEDAGPPGLVAVELGGVRAVGAIDGLLSLPDDSAPEVSIYERRTGEWVIEPIDADARRVADEGVVSAGGVWRVHLPQIPEGTPLASGGPALDAARFEFVVSADEERVELRVHHRGRRIALEPREHGYVLLTLARARLEGAELPPADRGWLDRDVLLRMLRMDANSFNVAVHRARQQLLAAGISGAAGIVEVRRGQRRFGSDRVQITRA